MYDDRVVLCGANAYERKFYINPDFDENGYVDSWELVTLKKALLRYK